MDSLQISTGVKRIPIVRDGAPAGELVFNPNDVVFAEKFYKLLGDFQTKFTQYQLQAQELEKDNTPNDNSLPKNMPERIALTKEACEYIHEQIDYLFGPGTSAIVFGDSLSLDAVQQFFQGVAPFIQTARTEKIQKYTNSKSKRK